MPRTWLGVKGRATDGAGLPDEVACMPPISFSRPSQRPQVVPTKRGCQRECTASTGCVHRGCEIAEAKYICDMLCAVSRSRFVSVNLTGCPLPCPRHPAHAGPAVCLPTCHYKRKAIRPQLFVLPLVCFALQHPIHRAVVRIRHCRADNGVREQLHTYTTEYHTLAKV